MDQTDEYKSEYPFEIGKLMVHNCTLFPLPIEDKSYDLVIACQVLEHFGILRQQVQFFNELERICKKAIISLPYKWFRPYHRDHHMIDEHVIKYWSNNRKPVFQTITGENLRSLRIIQIYDFENESSISNAEPISFKGYATESKKKDDLIEKLSRENAMLKNQNKQVMDEINLLKKEMEEKDILIKNQEDRIYELDYVNNSLDEIKEKIEPFMELVNDKLENMENKSNRR